jgi:DNA-directed RNA polymerase specialized sigma24 family protein
LNRVSLDDVIDNKSSVASTLDLLDLDEALQRLGEENDRAVRLVELRFFGGLSIEEAADVLTISRRTAVYEWKMARGWLHRRLAPNSK